MKNPIKTVKAKLSDKINKSKDRKLERKGAETLAEILSRTPGKKQEGLTEKQINGWTNVLFSGGHWYREYKKTIEINRELADELRKRLMDDMDDRLNEKLNDLGYKVKRKK